jgi:1,4-alpha-glucan branching enzyme
MEYSPRSRVRNGRAPLFLMAPLIWMITAGGAFAQQQERIVSPEVSADRRVTIRFRAPGAEEIAVRMDGFLKWLPMTKDERGVWSVTTEPLEPDYYGYSILMDGVALIDPNNSLLIPNLLEPSCAAYVSGPPSVPWETNDVPHGTVHKPFLSLTAGRG